MAALGRQQTSGFGWIAPIAVMAGGAVEFASMSQASLRPAAGGLLIVGHRLGERMTKHRIYSVSVASVYPHYVTKAEKKGRTKAEVDEIICWLTGYSRESLDDQLARNTNFEDFFAQAPQMNPSRSQITGVICGVRVEEIQETTMREIRYLDKLIDELAKGRAMEKILRK
ncbi:UNVERIFIED_ORG: hypothetical protein GGE44_000526 [Rhizobium esperanzae]